MRPGDKVGRYELEELLGEGATARVFAARQPLREPRFALKILKPEFRGNPEHVARFLDDARAVDRLYHPSIVRVVDVDIDAASGGPFIVMELVEGPPLDRILAERGRLGVREAARVAREVALALAAAHAAGIVHRDVKPSNVLIDARTGAAKLTDFGAAKLAVPGGPSRSVFGQIIGTLCYMAPEQVEPVHPVDARADVYALGATLYEMLAGAPAFPDEGFARTLNAVLHTVPPPLGHVRPDAPRRLAELVDRMLAKAADRRPASAAEVAEALAPFAAPAPEREEDRIDMKRLSAPIIGGVALAAVALIAWLLLPRVSLEPEPAAVRAALATVPCLAGDAALDPGGRVKLTGTAAHEDLVTEARDKVAAVPDVAGVDEAGLTVAAAPGCYGATRLERAVAAAGAGGPPPELGLNKPDGIYLNDDFLVLQAAMPPGLGGHLYVDVLTDAGAVYHLLPEELTPNNALPAGGRIRIGVEANERRQGVRDWQAAPPFGPAYIVATASERPLYTGLREVEEPGAPYVDLLLRSLAETPGAKAVRVRRVEFRPRP